MVKNLSRKKNLGKVYLIGAGPGQRDLITLKAYKILQKAPIVFYDYLVNPQILSYCPQAKCHYVGKVGHGEYTEQKKIFSKLLQAAKKYPFVVRLKGGDPYLLGRGGEEAEFLSEQGVPFEVVPGVTSALAVPAYAGIPVTHRDLSSGLSILTGHGGSEGLEARLKGRHHTYVFLMAVQTLNKQIQNLLEQGLAASTPAALIQWGTYPEQKTVVGTLANLAKKVREAGLKSPAVLVVGEVVKLQSKLSFYENKPLFNKKILITRSREQNSQLRELLEEEGAQVVELPVLKINKLKPSLRQSKSLAKLAQDYDWLLWTSVNGVEAFFAWLDGAGLDARALAGLKLGVVGPATEEALKKRGLQADFVPKQFSGEALAKALGKRIFKRRVLWLRAKEGSAGVQEALETQGAILEEWALYESVLIRHSAKVLREKLDPVNLDALLFASSRTALALVENLKATFFRKNFLKIPAVAIGPSTYRTLKNLGFVKIRQAKSASLETLVEGVKATLI